MERLPFFKEKRGAGAVGLRDTASPGKSAGSFVLRGFPDFSGINPENHFLTGIQVSFSTIT